MAAALVIVTAGSAQSSWRMGITLGALGNHAQYNGGMQTASALFTANKYGTGALGLTFRKTINDHLSFQTGFNFSSLGFEYALARDYSLTRPFEHHVVNRVNIGKATIPATLIWNFNPNCRNVRWFVGGGLSLVHLGHARGKNVSPDEADQASLGLNGSDYLSQTVTPGASAVVNAHLMGGVEKLFKRGSMLSLALYLNRGFAPVAFSDVTYSVNGAVYNHSFKNFNNFGGLMLTYYLKPFRGKN